MLKHKINKLNMNIPSKKQVQKAGKTLAKNDSTSLDYKNAMAILSLWRSLHVYPINAFNTLLRKKIKQLNLKSPLIAQRLKRTPSIIKKLQRFPHMDLSRMQDIGGLRIVLSSIDDVYKLHQAIIKSNHEPLLPPFDYIVKPKDDGYRSLHQVFKYKSKAHTQLDGLQVELQIRTKLQHAWATAVETLGLIEKSSFKTGEWTHDYSQFFKLASALFAYHEKQPILQELADLDIQTIITKLNELEQKLQIFAKLQGLILTAKHGDTKAEYHLMELDLSNNTVNLIPFNKAQFELAEQFYKSREIDTKDNPNIELVLISVGSIKDIKKAYPNYFLDTQEFIKHLKAICQKYA